MARVHPRCAEDGCTSQAVSRGYCKKHYGVHHKAGELEPVTEWNQPRNRPRGKEAVRAATASAVSKYKRAIELYMLAVGREARSTWWRHAVEVLEEAKAIGLDEKEIRRLAKEAPATSTGL
jgi:hypothetical protein